MLHLQFKKNISKCLISGVIILIALSVSIQSVKAATLSINPSTNKVSIGNIVSVKVVVGTGGKIINNSEGIVQFPSDLLDIISVNKGSSIFSMWVEEPKFSNIEGKVTFNGGLPNPGYIGENGEVFSITFRAKKAGTASVVLSDAYIRQNDGLGTDILTSKQGSTIQIDSAAQLEVPAVNTSSNNLPLKPIITSSTHPQQDAWYSNNTATFSWMIPSDITSIQTLLGKSPTSIPTVTYDASVSQRTVNNLTDGTLYFHLRYMNSLGWGPTAHYKIQVDSTSPEKFSLNVKNQDSQNTVVLNAFDALSGIDSYSIKIDENQAFRIKKDSLINNEYTLPVQNQGDHNLTVIAYDKAGNHTESNTTYSSTEIIAPKISINSDYVTKGESVQVSGITKYPQSNAIVTIQIEGKENKNYPTVTGDNGQFTVKTDEFTSSGNVQISSQLVFSENVKSPISNKISFKVNDTPFVKTTKTITYALSLIILIAVLILGLIFMTYLGWHKFFGLKKKLNKEMEDTTNDIHKAMMLFKDELANQLNKLEKIKADRDLNKKEEKIFKELQNNIDNIDEFIEKKLKRIK